jgi:hypothetical protein
MLEQPPPTAAAALLPQPPIVGEHLPCESSRTRSEPSRVATIHDDSRRRQTGQLPEVRLRRQPSRATNLRPRRRMRASHEQDLVLTVARREPNPVHEVPARPRRPVVSCDPLLEPLGLERCPGVGPERLPKYDEQVRKNALAPHCVQFVVPLIQVPLEMCRAKLVRALPLPTWQVDLDRIGQVHRVLSSPPRKAGVARGTCYQRRQSVEVGLYCPIETVRVISKPPAEPCRIRRPVLVINVRVDTYGHHAQIPRSRLRERWPNEGQDVMLIPGIDGLDLINERHGPMIRRPPACDKHRSAR